MLAKRKLNNYIVVYKPNSKYAMKSDNWSGWVYEHIYIMEQRINVIPENCEVHHLDGDVTNNRDDNLILLSKEDHTRLHNWLTSCDINLKELIANRMNSRKPKQLNCKNCGKSLENSQITFCSVSCQNKFGSKKPEKELLINKSLTEVSEQYKVTKKTVRKWFNSYGIVWQS